MQFPLLSVLPPGLLQTWPDGQSASVLQAIAAADTTTNWVVIKKSPRINFLIMTYSNVEFNRLTQIYISREKYNIQSFYEIC